MTPYDPGLPTTTHPLAPDDGSMSPRPPAADGGAIALLHGRLASALTRRFRLGRVLGTGSSGVVFEAFDGEALQPVAIKVLHRRDPQALLRLKQEFRQLVDICHPNLVAMHELFIDANGYAFFTMDLVQGARSFAQHQRPGGAGWALERLRPCLIQLVQAVEHLHARGKIHRDLKPSNVLIDREDRLRVVDFGLIWPSERPSTGGAAEGTPGYAAPEQMEGQHPTTASDWYAVGVMLHEVLWGCRPGAVVEAPKTAREERRVLALKRVCVRMLERDPGQRAGGRELLDVLGAEASAPARIDGDAHEVVFVGRAAELSRLAANFARANRALLIEGPSGVGKTSLALHFLQGLEEARRATVLRGRCFVVESIRHNALDGVIDALTQELSTRELECIPPAHLAALAQLFPVLRSIEGFAHAANDPDAVDSRHVPRLAVLGLCALLAKLAAQRPIVLFVDDLQWADAESARLLRGVLENPVPSVFVLATHRQHACRDLARPELERLLSLAERMTIGPLGEAAVVELASRVLPGCPRSLANEIARHSGGDPLLANELIRHASKEGALLAAQGVALEAALRLRLANLSPPARALLELICIAGRQLPRALLLEGAVDPLTALRDLRLAWAVRESPSSEGVHLEAYHERIRAFIVAELAPERRQQLHRQLADRLRQYGATYLDQAAHNYALGGQLPAAAETAEAAAHDAGRRFAFHRAAELLELALQCTDEPARQQRLRVAAGLARARAGRLLAAAEHYQAAADAATSDMERLQLRLDAMTAYLSSGHSSRGRELLARSAAEIGVEIDFEPMSFARGVCWIARLLVLGTPKLPTSGNAPASRRDAAALELLWRTVPALLVVDPERALQFAVRAMILAAQWGNASVYGQSQTFQLASFIMVVGRSSPLLEWRFRQAKQLVDRHGDIAEARLVRVLRASAASMQADHEGAIAACLGIAKATALGNAFAGSVRNCARGLVMPSLYWLGRLPELAVELERYYDEAVDSGDLHLQITCLVFGSHLHLRRDDVERARRDIRTAESIPVDYAHLALAEPWWRGQVELYAGEPERAQSIYERALGREPDYLQHCPGLRLYFLVADAQCAAALAMRGVDREANIARLERAVRAARRCGRSKLHDLAPLDAMLECVRGRPAAAVPKLQAALRLYRRRGMQLYVASMQLALASIAPGSTDADALSARATFARLGVASPERWAFMVAPGVFPVPDGWGQRASDVSDAPT